MGAFFSLFILNKPSAMRAHHFAFHCRLFCGDFTEQKKGKNYVCKCPNSVIKFML